MHGQSSVNNQAEMFSDQDLYLDEWSTGCRNIAFVWQDRDHREKAGRSAGQAVADLSCGSVGPCLWSTRSTYYGTVLYKVPGILYCTVVWLKPRAICRLVDHQKYSSYTLLTVLY